jgi:excisionase family DNA binding protein
VGPIRHAQVKKIFSREKSMEIKSQIILTAEEATRELRISLPTIRRYLATGKPQGRKLGKSWRVHRDSLKAFLTNGETIVN